MDSAEDSQQDIESLPEFQALVVSAAGKPERSMGDAVIPAEPPVWKEVLRLAKDLLRDPPHVAVLIYFTKAETQVNGYPGLRDALGLLRQTLADNWDGAQPLADPDDPDDAYYERINLLHELSGDRDFLDAISRLSLVEARGIGSFSSRDILISRGKLSASDEDMARCQEGLIRGAFQESTTDDLQVTAQAIAGIPDECRALEQLFAEKAGTSNPLSLSNLIDTINQVHSQFESISGDLLITTDSDAEPSETEQTAATADAAAAPRHPSPSAQVKTAALQSRDDVAQAFDRIIEYYLEAEPSSPLPILAVRARDMVPKNFFQAMQELAPAHQADFESLVKAVLGDPLSYLVQDSYRMFTSGELTVASQSSNSVATDETVAPEVAAVTDNPTPETENSFTQDGETVTADNPADAPAPLNQKTSRDGIARSLNSRAEVLDVLGNVDLYFSQNEPSSPVPLVVAEMRKLVSRNFTELLDEFSKAMMIDTDAAG